MKTEITTYTNRNIRCIALENEFLRVVAVPSIGGKVIEVMDRKTNHQFLLTPQNSSRWYSSGVYGSDFTTSDMSGFDDCFPTISPADRFPDHGELWSRSWNHDVQSEKLVLWIDGLKEKYLFEKTIMLDKNRVNFFYRLANKSASPFSYLWSAHPLLKITEKSEIMLPSSVNSVMIDWSSNGRFGNLGDKVPWPFLKPQGKAPADFSKAQPCKSGVALKCYTHALDQGYVGLYDGGTDQSILLEFDVRSIPYVGLWLCYGGWPENAREKHYTVGLEPCTGRPDSLDEAKRRGECSVVSAGATHTWSFSMSVWQGKPARSAH